MPLDPNEIDPEKLPRSIIRGGFKVDPTVELLRRVAWDYRELLHQTRALKEQVEEARAAEVGTRKTVEDLTAEIDRLRAEVGSHRDRDEAARTLLASAQRAARELRESARDEGERILGAARVRAKELEAEAERMNVAAAQKELARLQRLERQLRLQLTGSLKELLAFVEQHAAGTAANGEPPPLDSHLFDRIERAASS